MSIFKKHTTQSDRSASDRSRHKKKIEKAIKEGIHDIVSDESIIGEDGKKRIKIPVRGIKEYRFVDLPDVNRLIKKFINLHNFKFKSSFSTIDKFNEDTKSDLFISNYAFSELPKKIQKLSIKKIINNSKSGYMIVNNFYNFSFKFMNIKQYQKNIPGLCIHEEVPNSYIFNKILTFDNIE